MSTLPSSDHWEPILAHDPEPVPFGLIPENDTQYSVGHNAFGQIVITPVIGESPIQIITGTISDADADLFNQQIDEFLKYLPGAIAQNKHGIRKAMEDVVKEMMAK